MAPGNGQASAAQSEHDTDPPCPMPFACPGLEILSGCVGELTKHLAEHEQKLGKVLAAENKRSRTKLTAIGAIAVAVIGGLTQLQVTQMTTRSSEKAAEVARQKVDDSDRRIERLIEETSRRTARATLEERDRQVDRLASGRK
jgi:hypothetical protein